MSLQMYKLTVSYFTKDPFSKKFKRKEKEKRENPRLTQSSLLCFPPAVMAVVVTGRISLRKSLLGSQRNDRVTCPEILKRSQGHLSRSGPGAARGGQPRPLVVSCPGAAATPEGREQIVQHRCVCELDVNLGPWGSC